MKRCEHKVVKRTRRSLTHTWGRADVPDPNQISHQTNLIFFWSEDLFKILLLAEVLAGRSLRRLSLLCGMVDPNLFTTTTASSLPPISTALQLSRN